MSAALLTPLGEIGALRGAHAASGRFNGFVGLSYRQSGRSDGNESRQWSKDLAVGGATYIWQPWFARVDGDLDLSWVDTEIEDGGESEATLSSGRANLLVFPISRFPFRGFVERTDSRVDNLTIATDSTDRRRVDRIGFTQDYRPLRGDYSVSFGFTRTETDQIEAGQENSENDRWFASGRTNLGDHSFSARVDWDETETDLLRTDRTLTTLNADHFVQPADRLNIQDFLTVTDLRDDTLNVGIKERLLNYENQIRWSSPDDRLRFHSDITLQDRESSRGVGSSVESQDLQIRESLSYEWTRYSRISGSFSHSIVEQDSGSSTSTAASGSISYSPSTIDLAGISYNWSTFGSLSYGESSLTDSATVVSASISHGVSWGGAAEWFVFQSVSTSANQSLSWTGTDAETDNNRGTVTTNLTSVLSGGGESGSVSVSGNFSDTHAFEGDDTSVQVLSLGSSYSNSLGQHQTWNAAYSFSTSRANSVTGTTSSKRSSLSLNYLNSRLFGWRNLSFRSELEARADSLDPIFTEDDELPEKTWRNILEYTYRVGLLELKTSASNIVTEDDDSYVLFVTARRRFGGAF